MLSPWNDTCRSKYFTTHDKVHKPQTLTISADTLRVKRGFFFPKLGEEKNRFLGGIRSTSPSYVPEKEQSGETSCPKQSLPIFCQITNQRPTENTKGNLCHLHEQRYVSLDDPLLFHTSTIQPRRIGLLLALCFCHGNNCDGRSVLHRFSSWDCNAQLNELLWRVRLEVNTSFLSLSRRPSGLRKTIGLCNSLAHRTTWLRSDFLLLSW